MLFLYCVLLVCCAIMLVAGIVEQRRHFASLDQIPNRVLVNGIRGKSSITRLCAGALRGGGLTTVAKTTGTAARFIHPDATEEPVYRKFGIANVVEQIGIVRRAAAYRPDALVMECMAVMPALQEINQSKLIQSTIGVLCNVREDHVAEMGPTLDDIARSLSRSMPYGGICVTAEKERFAVLQEEADARDCQLLYADPDTVSDEELRGFSWFTFKENVAIALTVAELLGIDRATALQGMYDAPPDPGVLSVERYLAPGGKRLRFANVFAANDPESTLMNINQLLDLGAVDRPLNVVINCRPDRVERNGQMGAIIPELRPDKVFVIGHPARSAIDAIPAEWRDRAVDLGGDHRDGEEFLHELLGHLGASSSLVAIGNIHGQGEVLLDHLADLPPDESAPTPDTTPPPTPPMSTRPLAPYAADPHAADPHAADRYGADPYAGDRYGADPYAGDRYGADPYPRDPYAGDPYPGDPYAGDPYAADRYVGAGYTGAPYAGAPHGAAPQTPAPYPGVPDRGAPHAGAPYAGTPHGAAPQTPAPYPGVPDGGAPHAGAPYPGVPNGVVPQGRAGDRPAGPVDPLGIAAATPVPAWPQPQPQPQPQPPQVHPFPRQGHRQNPGEPR
ncbi:poly-gamma-glutamate synthase PgsB [Streptomyces sp. APSN-46.1]|uniref:poly-gamma-glutamate synthase PgsB n=1 Tax=Streptomyces sp. APSN-46.1 TaxID=2929049 RepID=UPI001FB319E3|nr:poly-gamma-glutamate synthase PgsB [Streptomyces sp. APSN-46.1]MCJ1678169.1 poly-gamma-glutamate synthase PgsB [Streptomyces sp. APSN-46.1]